eukprot:gene16793-18488_t
MQGNREISVLKTTRIRNSTEQRTSGKKICLDFYQAAKPKQSTVKCTCVCREVENSVRKQSYKNEDRSLLHRTTNLSWLGKESDRFSTSEELTSSNANALNRRYANCHENWRIAGKDYRMKGLDKSINTRGLTRKRCDRGQHDGCGTLVELHDDRYDNYGDKHDNYDDTCDSYTSEKFSPLRQEISDNADATDASQRSRRRSTGQGVFRRSSKSSHSCNFGGAWKLGNDSYNSLPLRLETCSVLAQSRANSYGNYKSSLPSEKKFVISHCLPLINSGFPFEKNEKVTVIRDTSAGLEIERRIMKSVKQQRESSSYVHREVQSRRCLNGCSTSSDRRTTLWVESQRSLQRVI